MKIGIGQINTRIGDFAANAEKIVNVCSALAADGAELAVFPECCVAGYPLKDLVFYSKFVEAAQVALDGLKGRLPIPAIVGCPRLDGGSVGVCNSAYLVDGRKIEKSATNTFSPTTAH